MNGIEYPNEAISLDEVGELLEQVAARDQRTTGETDVIAWWHDLNTARVNYRDAQAAVNHYYAVIWPSQQDRDRFRVTASKVIEIVKSVRRRRLATANWAYEPVDGETVEQYVQRYDAQRDAIADGRTPPEPVGKAFQTRAIAELVAATSTGTRLPQDVVDQVNRDLDRLPAEVARVIAPRRHPARTVRCPHCGAPPQQPCTNERGKPLQRGTIVHPSRTDAYATAAVECPTCFAEPGERCHEAGHVCAPDPEGRCRAAGHLYAYSTHRLRVEDATTTRTEAA